jgi:hypothetical protein
VVGGGAGLGRFVREFPTVAAMVADVTLIANDVCICIDTEPNRCFNVLASADPLIRNVVLDIAGGGGLQAHQVPGAEGRIWIGPPRGAGVDDAADITAALAYASLHEIPDVGCIPSPTVPWTIKSDCTGSDNVTAHWHAGDVVDVQRPGGIPWSPIPVGFNVGMMTPPGAPHVLLPIDPPTNAWCGYEGANTVLVASITVPSVLAVDDEVQIEAYDGGGATLVFTTHQIVEITPSGPNFLLKLDPPIAWPVPNSAVVTISTIVRPHGIVWDGHGATITGASNRFFHFERAVECGFRNWIGDNAAALSNFHAFDFGCLDCFVENVHTKTTAPNYIAFTLERNVGCRVVDCIAEGPWNQGYQVIGYRCFLTRPAADGCANSLNVSESWHTRIENLLVTNPTNSFLIIQGGSPGNYSHDTEIKNSVFRGQVGILTWPVFLDNNVARNTNFPGQHFWDAQTSIPVNLGGLLFRTIGNRVHFERLFIDGGNTTETYSGIFAEQNSLVTIDYFESFQVARALCARNGARIELERGKIDCTTAYQINEHARLYGVEATVGGRLVWEKMEFYMRPEAGGGGVVLIGGGFATFGEDTQFIGPSGSACVYDGDIRVQGKLNAAGVAGGLWGGGARRSYGTVQLTGNIPVAVAFADITVQDRVKFTPITYAGTPGKFPTYTIAAGIEFSIVGDALDTSIYAYEISG